MLTWAHYRFKQFLKFKAKEYSSNVIDVNEAYTSKTCSYCGTIQNIGSKKTMKCKNCGVAVDRDLNGARGIFLKNSSCVGGYARF
jgi:putative transposase